MASGINIHLRGYGDYYSLRAWKVDDHVQHAGMVYSISANLYQIIAGDGLTDFVRRFRRFRYPGTRYVCMPGARTPADPSYMAGTETGENASYDLNVFQAVRRWTNDVSTTPGVEPTSGSWNGDIYFLSDPHWYCCGITVPWKRFCLPYVFPDVRSFPMYSEEDTYASNLLVDGESSSNESESLSSVEISGDLSAVPNPAAPAKTWVLANSPRRDNAWHDTRVWNISGSTALVASPMYPHLLYRMPRTLRTAYSTRIWSDTVLSLASPITHPISSNLSELKSDLESRITDLEKEAERKAVEIPGCSVAGAFPTVKPCVVEKPEDVHISW